MAPLDTETLTHYITGNAAIHFPWRDATTGGWHRLAYWIEDKGEVRIALARYHYPVPPRTWLDTVSRRLLTS